MTIRIWYDGEVSELPKGEEYVLYCCQCGQAHALVFEGVRGKRARIRLHLKPGLTSRYRKRARLPMVPRDNST